MHEPSTATTFLFTDIEGSTLLWEQDPERMRPALARHDAIVRAAVESHRGIVVKTTGDGLYAAFADPLDAVHATVQLQREIDDPATTHGVALRVRCGLHTGVGEKRNNDYFGGAVNRAARIMSAAHGGQVLLSQAVVELVRDRLPAGVALRDLGSVRLRDLAGPERLYQVTHPLLRLDFPALRSLEATPNNLPRQMTSFTGRGHVLADVKGLLGKSRLLTLVGVGGIGKTRLSLQVAANVMDDYPDGVWFVELAPLTDGRLVSQAVASVLGVKEQAGRPVVEALVRYVKDLRLLIVLDNCEHLVRACADLAKQLLESAAQVALLASSREPLNVRGETTYSVPALTVPDPRNKLAPAALTQFEAVDLFVDRATAANPAFQVTDRNAQAVAEICQRLDGIPLALELAAARVRALAVENIAARLDDRFHLLVGGDRTALPRQQTLRALIDWSYDLLAMQERAQFRWLAVFAGSWTLDAVQAVGSGDHQDAAGALDLLTQLVEKSLVTLDGDGQRYRLLKTVRQYAQERLEESGESDAARTRHLEYFLALAERARPELAGPHQGAWLARLDLEHENLLAAHAWCDRAQAGGELGMRLVHSIRPYWFNRGLLGLGHRMTVEALVRAGAQDRNMARCRGQFGAGQLCCWMGRYGEAEVHLQESLAIAREIGDKARVAVVLQPLGIALLGQGNLAVARGHLEEAVALAKELGNRRELAAATIGLAQVHRVLGTMDTAEAQYESALALARELEDREMISIGLLNLAMVAIGRGAGERAGGMLLEVLAIIAETGSRPAEQSLLEVSAGLGALRAEWERSARFFGAAEAQTRQTGLQRDPADDAFLAPLIAKAQAALGASAFAAAEAGGNALSCDDAIAEARAWLEASRSPRTDPKEGPPANR